MAVVPNFLGPSYTSQSPNADAELCMNWYVERMESQGAKVPYVLYPCPGFTSSATVAQSPGRGLFATGGLTNRLFGVVGFKLYEYTSNGTVTNDRADLDSDGFPATFATNSAGQMMITSGGSLYCYTLSGDSIEKITTFSGGGIPIRQVTYLSDRFVALDATDSTFYWSAILDGSQSTGWDLGSATLRSTEPDPWVSMSVVQGQLWLLGSLTSDVYYTTNDPLSPYLPIPGALLEQGCAAGFSRCDLDSTLAWVGQNTNGRGMIWRSSGYAPVRISTHAVEYAIQGYSTIADAVAFAYQDQGHSFYVVNFPTAGATWVYDTATQLWHQRGFWNVSQSAYTVYRVQYAASCFNQNFVLDNSTGTLYTMSITVGTDVDGSAIRRERRSPHQWDGASLNRVFFPGMQIDMQTGLGLNADSTVPSIDLTWSDDGGLTYPVQTKQAASAGNLGQYQVRVLYLQLGSSRDRVWRLVTNMTVPARLLQAVYRPDPIVGAN